MSASTQGGVGGSPFSSEADIMGSWQFTRFESGPSWERLWQSNRFSSPVQAGQEGEGAVERRGGQAVKRALERQLGEPVDQRPRGDR